jgi:hypothetical protein
LTSPTSHADCTRCEPSHNYTWDDHKAQTAALLSELSGSTLWRRAHGRTSWTEKAAEQQYLISYEENALLGYVFRPSWMSTSPYKTRDQSKAECNVMPSQQVKRINDFTGFELAYTSARLRQACPDHHTDCRDCGSCRESRCGWVRVLSLSLPVLAHTSALLSPTDPRTVLALQC